MNIDIYALDCASLGLLESIIEVGGNTLIESLDLAREYESIEEKTHVAEVMYEHHEYG